MSERQKSPYDSIARRWLALIERREQHFVDLSRSGRWRHYYTQTEMRKVLQVRNQWAVLAGLPVKKIPGDDDSGRKAAPVPASSRETRRRGPSLVLVSTKPAPA